MAMFIPQLQHCGRYTQNERPCPPGDMSACSLPGLGKLIDWLQRAKRTVAGERIHSALNQVNWVHAWSIQSIINIHMIDPTNTSNCRLGARMLDGAHNLRIDGAKFTTIAGNSIRGSPSNIFVVIKQDSGISYRSILILVLLTFLLFCLLCWNDTVGLSGLHASSEDKGLVHKYYSGLGKYPYLYVGPWLPFSNIWADSFDLDHDWYNQRGHRVIHVSILLVTGRTPSIPFSSMFHDSLYAKCPKHSIFLELITWHFVKQYTTIEGLGRPGDTQTACY